LLKELSEKYPFLSVCVYADEEIVGIIQNKDAIFTTIYDFGMLPDLYHKEKFLELGEMWWWESNRQIPINLFLKKDWEIFRPYTKTFTNKNMEILYGPCTSLNDIAHKHRKRKNITLVKKID